MKYMRHQNTNDVRLTPSARRGYSKTAITFVIKFKSIHAVWIKKIYCEVCVGWPLKFCFMDACCSIHFWCRFLQTWCDQNTTGAVGSIRCPVRRSALESKWSLDSAIEETSKVCFLVNVESKGFLAFHHRKCLKLFTNLVRRILLLGQCLRWPFKRYSFSR